MFPGSNGNSNDFQVMPRDVKPVTARRQVRLYFIGVNVLRDGKPPIIHIAGRAYTMPPIGESIVVDELVAKELADRLLWNERDNPDPVPGVTTSAEIAAAVKEAWQNKKDGTPLNVRAMVANHTVKEVDTEVLVAELRKRGINAESAIAAIQQEIDLSTNAVSPDDPELTPAQKRAATNAANKAAKAAEKE